MNEWWDTLSTLNKAFYSGAGFFSVLFIWQLLSALIGLGGDDVDLDGDVDVDVSADLDHDGTYDDFEAGAEADSGETMTSFKLLSVRAIITFFTLFTWGGALYMNDGVPAHKATGLALIWGLAGGLMIAVLLNALRKLAETGNLQLATSLGTTGTVYLNIPENGTGEVKVTVSGVVSHVKARAKEGKAIVAGTPIQVVRKIGNSILEVEVVE
ncbi:MAG: hypothetical protein QGH15_17270 [Kiritimatiellia bacterium]|jgi:hypothetical protein|nr:hypothetical protein [Kiritimatiellia bacterium]